MSTPATHHRLGLFLGPQTWSFSGKLTKEHKLVGRGDVPSGDKTHARVNAGIFLLDIGDVQPKAAVLLRLNVDAGESHR